MAEFLKNSKKEKKRVVYVAGSFDLLTPGVIRLLKRVSELGDFVLVGLYSDDDIKEKVGNLNYPFLNVLERTLNLLSLKYVQDVIIGVPNKISTQFIQENKIDVIFKGNNFCTEYIKELDLDHGLESLVVEEEATNGFPLEKLLE